MATIMQKDVLIELIAYASATLAKRLPLPFNDDQKYLANLRNTVYSTPYQEIDYENLCGKVNAIRDKYKNMPVLPQFL